MRKIISGILPLLLSGFVHAQSDVILDGNETEDTASSPINLPFDINGFSPSVQGNYIRNNTLYTMPLRAKSMNFKSSEESHAWLKTKNVRLEYGIGIGYNLSPQFIVGLNAYKGSIQSETHQVNDPNEKINLKYPKKLSAFEDWKKGDSGRYQTYGGISVSINAGIGMVNLANSSITFQNQFWLEIQKISKKGVQIIIREEKLDRRNIMLGPMITRFQYSALKGNQFLYKFQLDLSLPEHHELYAQALKGNIIAVQSKVKKTQQELSWTGSLKQTYVGIPKVVGITYNRTQYKMKVDEQDIQFAMDKRENMGLLASREHFDLASIDKEKLTLVWKSELKKLHRQGFKKAIYSKTRTLAPGLIKEKLIPEYIGQLASMIMVSVKWSQLTKLKNLSQTSLITAYQKSCEEQKLKCRRARVAKKQIKKFAQVLKEKKQTQQMSMGKLFMRSPLFFRVIMESLDEDYTLQFQLLMEKWQSLEGSNQILV